MKSMCMMMEIMMNVFIMFNSQGSQDSLVQFLQGRSGNKNHILVCSTNTISSQRSWLKFSDIQYQGQGQEFKKKTIRYISEWADQSRETSSHTFQQLLVILCLQTAGKHK